MKQIQICAAWIFASSLVAIAQQAKVVPLAPVPIQIATAKKAFISNVGGESFETVFDQAVFNGGPDRPYNQFYAAMRGWGHYELVPSPADADLILVVRWVLSDTGLKLPVLGLIEVDMVDPKTHVTLWTLREYVRGALLLGNRDKNFDHAMNTIVDRARKLAEGSRETTEATK